MRSTLGRLTVIAGTGGDGVPPSEGFLDALWLRLRQEAREAYAHAPMLAPLFVESILNQPTLEAAAFHRIAARLKNDLVGLGIIIDAFNRAVEAMPEIAQDLRTDIAAVVERDPACARFIEPFLYFKGFHAIQTHRLAHWLWHHDERDFALYLQSRSSDVFQTDIHPAARFGRGIFLDHATGLVVGETAVVENDVCLLQNVTLGGTGKDSGDRHPKVRQGAMIGAGAKILGNIEIGASARVAAGSVVLRSVEAGTTVAGVPAKLITRAAAPTEDQILNDLLYESFAYTI
ncbi:serine O-acetyltransferase [Rhodospirillum rubrum]|uniref:Serine acetyltransferase n=1 Tax=Rhodospirillum rubrum (strain ATCC 11170 / ATH 1.1.1 / DSM 467 / LMG 4362 / NCIMB 8255 / S1) TaxID=269796 RepID=Q2RW99_RHORT|nr:serine O-acetyltransferase [Rhodospirillum rubrum]ABC21596.1 serine O-acetyltransferase [Rhodospirillum rubrum ATCC 11170]AEO47283.1 serine O-acetyltransferase [Rhodospirillum rubrum F11]MBK5955792.1 serine acetyltransferase [Rhodospirillum rubrum]QXG81266.1 serine O-acetyltransferase [Rhodospirillum rubrum]HAP99099.1 serine O-acetyltransferase [Rhodospirillum rubrum]